MKLIVTDREVIATRIRKMVSADYHVAVVAVPAETVGAVALGDGVHLRYASALATPVVAALRYAMEEAGTVLIALSPGSEAALVAHIIAHALSTREATWTILSELSRKGVARAIERAAPLRRADVESAATRAEIAAIYRFFTGRLSAPESAVTPTVVAALRVLFRNEATLRAQPAMVGARLHVDMGGWSAQLDHDAGAAGGEDGACSADMLDRAEWSSHMKVSDVTSVQTQLAAPAPYSGFGLCEELAAVDHLSAGEMRSNLCALYLSGWITWPFGGVALLSPDARARAIAFAQSHDLAATSARAITVARSRADSAVVPVDFAREDARLSPQQRKIYRRIWARALAAVLAPAASQHWTVKLHGVLQEDLRFTATGHAIEDPGWTAAYALADVAVEGAAALPPVRVGQFLRHQGCRTEEIHTGAGSMTVGKLVKAVRTQTADALDAILEAIALIELREWTSCEHDQLRLTFPGLEYAASLMERMRRFVDAATDSSIDTQARAVAASQTDRARVIAALYERLGLLSETLEAVAEPVEASSHSAVYVAAY